MWRLCLLLAVVAEKRIGLVEEHHHVLVHLINATKHGLPSKGVTLIHFDSHADMSVSGYFPPSLMNVFDTQPENIVEATQINSWVSACWFLGIVDRMIFIEPPWGSEFRPVRNRELVYYAGTVNGAFKLDIMTKAGKRVNSEYWHTVDDNTLPDPLDHFADHTTMTNKHQIEVLIVPFEELLTKIVPFVQKTPSAPVFLDIDLDCFSTESPAHLSLFEKAGIPLRFQQLAADMYHQRTPPFSNGNFSTEWWRGHLTDWKAQCPALQKVFDTALGREKNGRPSASAIVSPVLPPPEIAEVDNEGVVAQLYDKGGLSSEDDGFIRTFVVGLLQTFAPNFERLEQAIGAEEAAQLLSRSISMPVHLGTQDEINVMIGAIECMLAQLKELGRSPVFTTLARSPYYTPVHHLKHIECAVLAMISRQIPDMKHIYHEENLDADYAHCDLGFQFYDIGRLVENDFGLERTSRGVSMPVEVIVANSSPEPLVMQWKDFQGGWLDQIRVAPYSYDGENWLVYNGHELRALTTDGFTISELTLDAEQGHTQLWTFTTGQVDEVLRKHGVSRHRDI